MTYNKYVLSFIMLLLSSCNSKKEFVCEYFTMEIPVTWKTIDFQMIEGWGLGLLTDQQDTISIYVSNSTDNLVRSKTIRPIQYYNLLDSMGFDVEKMIFSETNREDEKLLVHMNHYYDVDTIAGKTVRLAIPKDGKTGLTGIYFKKIHGNSSLTILSENLDSHESKELLESFQTISFTDQP